MISKFKDWIQTQDVKHYNLSEKLLLKDWSTYRNLVAVAYEDAPVFDENAVKHWNALNESNHTLFKRLISKVDIIIVSVEESQAGRTYVLQGKPYVVQKVDGDPYPSQKVMKADYEKTGTLMISMDYSDHPIFSVEDNIIFRSVHDFIVHILGDYEFGDKGEIASYNLHAKLAPPLALPALFTEVIGQACYAVEHGDFPVQKIAILDGFDYYDVGRVKGHDIVDKTLI